MQPSFKSLLVREEGLLNLLAGWIRLMEDNFEILGTTQDSMGFFCFEIYKFYFV